MWIGVKNIYMKFWLTKMKVLIIFVVSLFAVNCVDVKKYLEAFGYYNPNSFDQSDVKTAIKNFQKTFGLSQTGNTDAATQKLINTPRCGLSDHDPRRNAFAASKWNKNALTYYFHNYTPDLTRGQVRQLTAKALKFWSDVSPLTFREQTGSGDIVIAFGTKTHSDDRQTCGYPFNGPSGVLAHAFYPPDGRLHFDDDEHYTDRTSQGTNYLWVAVHELGHILGLAHDTTNQDAVMYPYYRAYTPNMKLHSNDIYRLQSLYRGGPPPSGCKDKYADCQNEYSKCKNYSDDWTDWMKKNCYKTCRYC